MKRKSDSNKGQPHTSIRYNVRENEIEDVCIVHTRIVTRYAVFLVTV